MGYDWSSPSCAGERASSRDLEGDDDLAYLLIALEIPVGFNGLIEGEGPCDLRLKGSIRQAIIDVLLHGFPLRAQTS